MTAYEYWGHAGWRCDLPSITNAAWPGGEHKLAKVGVEGSNPFARPNYEIISIT
jgi:hypothetical protein